ncbi:hypothetical protein DSL72_009452 [Monilinia vaccinii-corymbosi]|uniref:RNA-dependent RNA polymerase n=1 Tax=Monilinia vaccinii-corymbosi TaxID=61207 RepID=A0A8A3PR41_9HELO|nr:hypothetical protein DSL72_009452 [Monilinia vaccinii-corymbosi]
MSAIPKTPKTPSLVDKAKNEAAAQSNKEINAIYNSLTWQWDLRLPSTTFESPSDRRSKSKSEESDLACEIVGRIRYLYYKAHVNLFAALDKFDQEATHMYVRWVQKPNADREVIPETTEKRPHPVTPSERIELLKRLQIILCELFNNTQSLQRSVPSKANSPVLSAQKTQIDDSPVAFPLSSAQKHDGKRRFEPFTDINIGAKKAKGPEARASGRENFYRFPPPQWNVSRPQKTTTKTDQVNLMPLKGDMNVNMNTSFETNVPDVFSQSFSSTLLNTQSTDPESEPKSEPEPEPKPELTIKLCSDHLSLDDDVPKTQSSDFGSIFDPVEAERVWTESFGANIPSPGVPKYDVVNDTTEGMSRKVVDEVLDKTVDDPNPKKLERCLNEMLPILPSCLKRAPFFVSYEITRVFLSLQVPISDFTLPYVKEWIEYDKLWKMLKTLPILQDKKFPEKCGAKVWEIAANGYSHGFNGVVFAASLRENKTQSEPLFSFQLQPMKLDLTNRLERIFGSDRFFEFEIPDLERKRYGPKVAKVDDNTWGVLKSWLVNGDHQLLGRTYKSFFVKIKDRKRKSSLKSDAEEESSVTPFRAFLFATDGYGFVNGSPHARMTVEELLDFIRPTSENKNQPYMKLFARTALVLSRNQATVTVERTQIRYKNDIRNPDLHNPKKTYVMTDGAGKMSLSLAKKIVFKLNLFHIPSAFQGRFGEAKGLWIVDRSDDIENDWIELYSEQCKWNRGEEGGDEFDHRSRRTFEVVGHSTPLKTADLNTQLLPLLMHQATNRRRMRGAIIKALKEGLSHSLEELKTALTGPRELRSWVRPTNSSIRDRIKTGAIQWRGGLPAKHEDRLSILLDAGFDPRSSSS